jgi:hypothetical protein
LDTLIDYVAKNPTYVEEKQLTSKQQAKLDTKKELAAGSAVKADKVPVEKAKAVKLGTIMSKQIESSPTGKTIDTLVDPQTSIKTTIKVPQLSDVVASMDSDGVMTSGYPMELQPRDIERASSRRTIQEVASKPGMASLLLMETLQHGIPVVTQEGYVLAGNHRVAGINKMKRDYPENYDKYKKYVIANAEKLGINPNDLKGDFIAVRVLPKGVNPTDFAEKGNIDNLEKMSPTEIAKIDAKNIKDVVLSAFSPSETGEINTAGNRAFIARYVENVIPRSERKSYMDKDGKINNYWN